jgi:nucleoside-diphosphate-sugar epimerase
MGAVDGVSERVLVTGAAGFIGRWTLGPLRRRGVAVHAVTRGDRPSTGDGVTWHRADLLDRAEADALIAAVRPSHLLHLAWYVTPGAYLTSLENLRWVGATLDLVEAFARAGGRRVVVAGTSAEYAPANGVGVVEDRTPLAPATVYAASKHGLHVILTAWAAQVGVSLGWGRVFFLHGPGEASVRLVPQLVRAAVARTPFPLRYPAQVRDYLHVADVAGGLVALLLSDVQGAVNIAAGHPVALADLARYVGEYVGAPLVLVDAATTPDPVPWLVADASRLRAEVGYVPQYSLAEGLRDTVSWWQDRVNMVVT